MSGEEEAEAARRFKVLKERPEHLRLVRPGNATVPVRTASPRMLSLSTFDVGNADAAAARARGIRWVDGESGKVVPGPDSCGDPGPLLRQAVVAAGMAAIHGLADSVGGPLHEVFEVLRLEAEITPLSPDVAVRLCARGWDLESGGRCALVTGWIKGEAVLRMRLEGRVLAK
eukprot:gnl/TRDRNA2_/TRDRNA2_138527_c1_seq1.p1 gnl/TRDRNA2_/TRDRNA2_138527_c1~~gnl/TRDRNA2_/TRDRNA2_138527_c1_seq1.p1  ORF type:complete len:187 (+),score=26.86 gnl/TRDRNA2_/TRDRNA2_138527_c1_seq1:46-561(+)